MAPVPRRSFLDTFRSRLALLSFALAATIPAFPQGLDEYCNFEAPQVKPVALATIPGFAPRQYLLACNTPDNAIEVFDVTGALRDDPQPVARIPVGLEPVSVVFQRISIAGQGTRNMLYAVNWLGDSVTFVELSVGPNRSLQYVITREVRVTEPREFQDEGQTVRRCDDEPMHLAVVDRPGKAGQFLVVAKRAASSYSLLHPFTGAFLPARDASGAEIANGGRNVIMTSGALPQSQADGQVVFGESPADHPGIRYALKEPHAVAWRPGSDEFWVLGHKGGGSLQADAFGFDFGLWGIALESRGASGLDTYYRLGGLGTVNFNLAFDPEGQFLYVVGTRAQDQLQGNGVLLDSILTRTGFATTVLYRVDMARGVVDGRDLNLAFPAGAGDAGEAVDGPSASLAHATDVVVYREPTSAHTFACVSGFHSSRFGMVRVDDADPRNWTIATVNVESEPGSPTVEAVPARAEAGPRGLAVLATGTAADDRAYLLNRLDATLSVIALNGGDPVFVRQLPLQRRAVEPAHVREGRKFLYSTRFSGPGSPGQHGLAGFVSCASCHVDGRVDGVSWRLTAAHAENPALSSVLSPPPDAEADALELSDAASAQALTGGFPSDPLPPASDANAKGPMTTQSLQGLLDFEVGGSRIVQDGVALSTGFFADEDDAAPDEDGGPYDDASGNPFDDLVSSAPYHWRGDKESLRHFNEAFVHLQGMPEAAGSVPAGGLRTAEMRAFERFVHSIHYPPNPLQPERRKYSGERWSDPEAFTGGASGAMLGLKIFHIRGVPQDPVASGRSCVQCHTLPDGSNNRITAELGGPGGLQPVESASLRGVVQKDAMLRLSPAAASFDGDDEIGILTGDFGLGHLGTFAEMKSLNGFVGRFGFVQEQEEALNDYLRQLDSGVAPIVGLSFGVTDPSDPGQARELERIATLEEQVGEANCGLAVHARVRSGGAWVSRSYWFDVTHQPPAYKQAGAATWLSRVELLGSLTPAQPSDLLVFRGTPLGSDRRVASFALASSDLPAGPIRVPAQIRIVGTTPNTANEAIVELARNADPAVDLDWTGASRVPLSLRVLKALQKRLGIHAAGGSGARHDAPRRLQVTGTDLVPGARLRLTLANVATATGPAWRNVELPLYPTTVELDGARVWETEAEFDPRALYTLMLGGPASPEVDHELRGRSGSFQPAPRPVPEVRVQAANVPYAEWSAEERVPFRYPKVVPGPRALPTR